MKRATSCFIVYIITALCISIHALVKRATCFVINILNVSNISIHALVKRATVWATAWCRLGSEFQSTPS